MINYVAVFSQDKPLAYISISQNSDIWINATESDLSLGIAIPIKKKSLILFSSYQFGGNYGYDAVKAYKINHHFLGGGVKYRFRSVSKLYSPTITIQALTEIHSNYTGRTMGINGEGDRPLYFPEGNINDIYYTDKNSDYVIGHRTFDYISTPLTFNAMLGNEFKVFKDLFINVSIGYLCKYMRAHKKTWWVDDNEPISEIKDKYKLRDTKFGGVYLFKHFEFGLGINYTFPFKKQSKTTTP